MGQYRHDCVADLAWALSSPPLLGYRDSDCIWFSDTWYRDQYGLIEKRLQALDRNPAELEALLGAQKDQRLGNYFETLWSFALELHPRYQLIERNLQIRDGERTIGEMDFIVFDTASGRYAHWELAIKFYLGIGDTARQDAWFGPGKKDRLDLKVRHLRDRQILLSRHPVARAQLERLGIELDDRAVILKGRLFYPWAQHGLERHPCAANPAHLFGHWLTRSRFEQAYDRHARFVPLIRSGWMAGRATLALTDVVSVRGLLERVESGSYRLPIHVARVESGREAERLFVVDDGWEASPESVRRDSIAET